MTRPPAEAVLDISGAGDGDRGERQPLAAEAGDLEWGYWRCYRGSMSQVKLSVSLSPSDVAALDHYARAAGLKSRSAAIQQAIRLLGDPELEGAYAAAWDEWEASGDAESWAATVADGLE